MRGGFRVDMGALERAAAGVDATLDQVGQESVGDIPHDESVFGHQRLTSSLAGFLGAWETGVNNLTNDGREIAARLTASARLYHRAEQANRAAIANGFLTGRGPDPGEQ